MTEFKIEKNIPMPPLTSAKNGLTATLRNMEIGDSTFVNVKTTAEISSSLAYVRNRYKFKFASRHMGGGIRLWRTA